MARDDPETDGLVERAAAGDASAFQELLGRHRVRLRRMVAVRMDRRMSARLDPSDVVQETLAEAARRLDDYLAARPLPFYPWLRRLAWERLVQLHRTHVYSQKRSVAREEPWAMPLPEDSVADLADRFVSRGTSPSERLVRQEVLDRVRAALADIAAEDREILILRYLEQLTTEQAAAVMGITPAAAKSRHFRAIERLHDRLSRHQRENRP